MRELLAAVMALVLFGCGPEESSTDDRVLKVSWAFSSGDCTSNSIDKVKVSWGADGMALTDVEFACSAGSGTLGQTAATGGTYSIIMNGLDTGGVVRFSTSSSLTVGARGTFGVPVDMTLRPKPSNITVTWHFSNGSGCPAQVQLPYAIGIYNPPAMGTGLGTKVKDTQEGCATKTATLTDIAPGTYIVDLDSRAQQPMIHARKNITVVAGENQTVDLPL
ncbi:MAG: hypothetical protein QM817_13265 [Archangium sp.]